MSHRYVLEPSHASLSAGLVTRGTRAAPCLAVPCPFKGQRLAEQFPDVIGSLPPCQRETGHATLLNREMLRGCQRSLSRERSLASKGAIMSSATLIRWSGLAALVGNALLAVVSVAFVFAFPEDVAQTVTSNTWLVLNVLILIAYLLCLVGLVGLYARQAEKAGILGLVAFLLTFLCIAPRFAWYWIETFVFPILAQAAPRLLDNPEPVPPALNVFGAVDQISVLLLLVGVLLFGVASLRARVLPRWAALLVLVGAVLDLVMTFAGVDFPFGAAVAGPGLAWMGYAVWAHKEAPSASLAPVTAGGPSLASH
jgi:hypothetical protein